MSREAGEELGYEAGEEEEALEDAAASGEPADGMGWLGAGEAAGAEDIGGRGQEKKVTGGFGRPGGLETLVFEGSV